MSHFTAMVFSNTGSYEEIEKLLAPFHEFECTGINDEWVQDVDILEEVMDAYHARGENYMSMNQKEFFESWFGRDAYQEGEELDSESKYGYAIVNEDGELIRAVNRTNPNAKWDCWVIGGRWNGYFRPKNEVLIKSGAPQGEKSWGMENIPDKGWVNNIQIKDIDLDGMRESAIAEANSVWDILDEILKGRPMPCWEKVREEFGEDIEGAREAYNGSRVVKDLRLHDKLAWGCDSANWGNSREEHVDTMVAGILTPYAFVDNNGWHQKGNMGWWGMSSDDMPEEDWDKVFSDKLMSVGGDTWVTLVDCHI
jgi:hypothetical protein